MGNIILALPKLEDAKHISDILARHGIETAALCTTGAQTLTSIQDMEDGIIICGSRFRDMHYTMLMEYLPDTFDMILLASALTLASSPPKVMALELPLKVHDLTDTIEMILRQQAARRRRRKEPSRKRTRQEQDDIDKAKWVLMERNRMSEEDAFRYIQKSSMNSGTNMSETAQMILMLFNNSW